MTVAGFPHSGITGSQPACGSPMLIAAYHALHRLSVPRHPPCALLRLTGKLTFSASSHKRVKNLWTHTYPWKSILTLLPFSGLATHLLQCSGDKKRGLGQAPLPVLS